MNMSFDSEEHNIYSPKFSSPFNSEGESIISIDQVDEMNAKNDPLFDAYSIEEIKIYSNYPQIVELDQSSTERKEISLIAPRIYKDPNPIYWEPPHIKINFQNKKDEEVGGSLDNTHQMSSTMPSFNFSFKNKNYKNEGISQMNNSQKNEQINEEMFKSKIEKNTFESLGEKSQIPKESKKVFENERNTPSQSRNINIFNGKLLDESLLYRNFQSKNLVNPKKLEIYPGKISEYSVKTYSWTSLRKDKILYSLKYWKSVLRTGRKIKKSLKNKTQKIKKISNKVVKILRKNSYKYKTWTNRKINNRLISNKNNTKLKSILRKGHKYNKSYRWNPKRWRQRPRNQMKNSVDYSVYLSKNTENGSEERDWITPNLYSDQKYSKTKKLSLNYASSNSKYSENSSGIIFSDEGSHSKGITQSNKINKRMIYLNSTSYLSAQKTDIVKNIRKCPKIFSYNLNSWKSEFAKVNIGKRKEQRHLEDKLKKLKKKTENMTNKKKKVYQNSKHLKICLEKEEGKLEKKSVTSPQKFKISKSINTFSTKNSIFQKYWKSKKAQDLEQNNKKLARIFKY